MSIHARVPNLFVIGVPKAGTTSLFRWLGDHPAIGKSNENELRYLIDESDPLCRSDGYNAAGLEGYGKFYRNSLDDPATRYLIDVSPQYYYQNTAKAVIGALPDAQILMILRKPSARIYSLYNYSHSNRALLLENMGFPEFINEVRRGEASDLVRDRPMLRYAIEHSKYARYVKEWQSLIDPQRLTICLFEDLVRDPTAELRRIAQALNIDPSFYDDYAFPVQNESIAVRSRPLHKFLRRIRGRMPGWMRSKLKPAYMRLNTRKRDRTVSEADRQVLSQLDEEFATWDTRLAELLGRDGPVWGARTQ